MAKKQPEAADNRKPKPKPITSLRLDPDLMEAARNRVYWTPGLTLGGLVESAIRRELTRLEKLHGPPPNRPREALRTGRPVS